ncbi:pilus assembly protein [Streptomyces sp. NPDC050560]|uniref:pilus assembly protein n=1 Tax=Streptomyces sp. NPDC050560 TaxID=3365630 RepID=UPI00378CDA63
MRGAAVARAVPVRALRRRLRAAGGERGQVALEFVSMTPAILVIVVLLWQAAIVGYTFVLAGNAADRAVRAAAVGDDCETAARQDLPAAWSASISCGASGAGLVEAHVDLKVPLLFPGAVNMPITVPGTAAAAEESDR